MIHIASTSIEKRIDTLINDADNNFLRDSCETRISNLTRTYNRSLYFKKRKYERGVNFTKAHLPSYETPLRIRDCKLWSSTCIFQLVLRNRKSWFYKFLAEILPELGTIVRLPSLQSLRNTLMRVISYAQLSVWKSTR